MDVLSELGVGFMVGVAILVGFLTYRVGRELIAAWRRDVRDARRAARERRPER